jgi:hypothetical protein
MQLRTGAASFKRVLGADANNLATLGAVQGVQNGWRERPELLQTIGPRADHDHRDAGRRDILLKWKILIDRKEDIEV